MALGCAIGALFVSAAPALADVKGGVDAWSRGDYAAAVREWEGPAAAGDADAMFNLAQAYRLGRGVELDMARAEALYARAAAAGHLQAADTYGLMLFQDGRREAALPYVQEAAKRGDPRSEYLLGIAHFNGDLLPRDYVRAYALMNLANAAGLPQATQALAQMDQHIPLAQRQQGVALSGTMRQEADAMRTAQLAAADLGTQAPGPAPAPTRPVASPAMRPPQAIATTAVSPSVSAARAAVAAASGATGAESPAQAGASYARTAPPVQVASAAPVAPPRVVAPAPAPTAAPAKAPAAVPVSRPAAGVATTGPWRVQLGAFSVPDNASKLWQRLSPRAELSGRQRLMVPAGRITKLQAGGFASRSAAEAACRSLSASGQDCIVTDR
jgi:TPR repeat protein